MGVRVVATTAGDPQHLNALQRCHRHRKHPTDHQGNPDDGEQARAIFAGALVGGIDRIERHHRDNRRAQQRPCRFRRRFHGGLDAVHAFLQANGDTVGDNDRIVDHHTERHHQGTERHALEIDAK